MIGPGCVALHPEAAICIDPRWTMGCQTIVLVLLVALHPPQEHAPPQPPPTSHICGKEAIVLATQNPANGDCHVPLDAPAAIFLVVAALLLDASSRLGHELAAVR